MGYVAGAVSLNGWPPATSVQDPPLNRTCGGCYDRAGQACWSPVGNTKAIKIASTGVVPHRFVRLAPPALFLFASQRSLNGQLTISIHRLPPHEVPSS